MESVHDQMAAKQSAAIQAQLHQSAQLGSINQVSGGYSHNDYSNAKQVPAGYGDIRPPTIPFTQEIAERTSLMHNTASETLALLTSLRDRMLGPQPSQANEHAKQHAPSNGFAELYTTGAMQLQSVLNQVEYVARELATRL